MTHTDKSGHQRLFAAIDTTWPAHRIWVEAGWTLREGRGGGKRVSAATRANGVVVPDIDAATRAMRAMGQDDLFMIRPQDTALDRTLANRGFDIIDPVVILHAPLEILPRTELPAGATLAEAPDADMATVWQAGGIGEGRLNVMGRCALPKACIGLRVGDTPVAAGFAALDGPLAMAHAVEVIGPHRGQGHGKAIMYAALAWARGQGATEFAVITTAENAVALNLYRGMGFRDAGAYHYRIRRA